MDYFGIRSWVLTLAAAAYLTVLLAMPNRIDAQTASAPNLAAREKIDSQLLQALSAKEGARKTCQGPTSAITAGQDGRVTVDISATVTDAVLDRIRSLGGSIVSSFPQYQAIRASVPLDQLEAIASIPEVRFIRPAEIPATNPAGGAGRQGR